jgi:hypothetical protein
MKSASLEGPPVTDILSVTDLVPPAGFRKSETGLSYAP